MVAEHLRLGSWDLIKGFTGCGDTDIKPRIAMQVVNEAAMPREPDMFIIIRKGIVCRWDLQSHLLLI